MLERKQAVENLLKEWRNTEVEEWRVAVVAEGGVTQKAAAGSRSSEAEGDLFVSEAGSSWERYGGGIIWPSQGAAAEKKSSNTCKK